MPGTHRGDRLIINLGLEQWKAAGADVAVGSELFRI